MSNGLRVASSSASVALPAVGGLAGAPLSTIMWWVVISRLLFCGLSLIAIRRAVPSLKWRFPRRWSRSREMLSFGGWVLVSNAISPVLTYFDRFALGAIVGVAAVGFYTAPYEGVTRLGLVAVSLGASMLPALSSLNSDERALSAGLVSSSMRTVTLLMVPPLAVIFVFAPGLLELWLDSATAEQSGMGLRILSIGVFANALAQIPLITLYAFSRPDLPAKFHLAELVVHLPLAILLVSRFGIAGAALAWTVRVWLDLFLLLAGTARCLGVSMTGITGGRVMRFASAGIGLVVLLFASAALSDAMRPVAALLAIASVVGFLWLGWSWIMLTTEKSALTRIWANYRGASG